MEIQSLSVVVPTKKCVNDCPFCVSKLHENRVPNQIEDNQRFRDLYLRDYVKRLQFARDNGCNTVVLTGDGEPLQNTRFLSDFSMWNGMLTKPFQWIELQSTGIFLNDEKLRFLRNTVGVTTISLSVSDLFNDDDNCDIIGVPPKSRFKLDEVAAEIKKYDFNLRISINLLKSYNGISIKSIFERVNSLNADQVIFREMYESHTDEEIDKWIVKNAVSQSKIEKLKKYIEDNGRPLEILPFGAVRYSLHGLSTVLDSDCMSGKVDKVLRYLILKPNCKLYSKWDDDASLLF